MNQCPFCKNELFSDDLERCPSCGQEIVIHGQSDDAVNDSVETFISDEFLAAASEVVETIDDPIITPKSSDSSSEDSEDSFSDDDTYVADELAERAEAPAEHTIAFEPEAPLPSPSSKEPPREIPRAPVDSDGGDSGRTVEVDPEGTISEIQDVLGTLHLNDTGASDEEDSGRADEADADATYVLDDDDPLNSATVTGEEAEELMSGQMSGERTLESDDLGVADSSADEGSYDATMISDDLDRVAGTDSSQTLVSDLDANENELKTLESNWAAKPGERPEMTIKSRKEEVGDEEPTPRDTITSVPLRSLRSVNEKQTPGLETPEYELLSILGEGGMGIVWSAKQTSVDRKVAVKMIKGNFAKKSGQRNKFLAEAIVTGDLDHPNIVPIYDVGTDKLGTLFYAMKQVQGTPWLKVIKEKSLHDNLEIFLRVADAVAFAHARGIVHRDLKPENVMLGGFGEVLVMDWGLSLPMNSFHNAARIRAISSMGGTPAYMSPEMATGPIDRITPQSDIYLLGAILWEIVTGRPPHPGKKVQQCLLAAMRNTIRETEKTGELIDIAKKAMATNMKERHSEVRELQEEVRSYLDHSESLALGAKARMDLQQAEQTGDYNDYSKAVFGFEQARDLWTGNKSAVAGIYEAKLAYARNANQKADYDLALSLLSLEREDHAELRTQVIHAQRERDARQVRLKLAKRAMFAMAACFLVVVSIAFVIIRAERNEALNQKSIAVSEREEAKRQEKIADEQRVIAVQKQDEAEQASAKLQVALVDVRKQKEVAETQRLKAEQQENIAKVNETEAKRQAEIAAKNEKEANAQKLIAVKNEMEAIKQKEVAETQRLKAEAQEKIARQERDEADRQRKLAIAAKEAEEYEAYIARIGLAAAKIDENAFDVATELLAQCPESHRNWEWGRLMHLCSQASEAIQCDGPVDAVSVSPDGKFLLTGSWDHKARIWDLESQKLLRELPQEGLYVHAVAWSPNQEMMATAGSDATGRIRLWSAATGELLAKFNGHTEPVVSVRFSPNGEWLLTCSYDQTARLWNIKNPAQPVEIQTLKGHSWWVWDGAFSPDFDPQNASSDNRIVTVSQDGKAIIWRVGKSQERTPFTTVSFQQGDKTERPVVYEAVQESIFTGHQGPIYAVAFAPHGREVATASYDKRVLLWNPADVPAFSLENLLVNKADNVIYRELSGHLASVQAVTYSRDGQLVITGSRDNAVKIWDVKGTKTIKTFRGHYSGVRDVAITPDGRKVISGAQDNRAIIWYVDEYEEFRVLNGRELVGHDDAVLGTKFSSDGQQILTAGRDRTARLWDSSTGEAIRSFHEGHDFLTSRGLILPGGRVLATSAADNSVRLWNVESGTQILRIPDTGRAAIIANSLDGNWIVTGYEASPGAAVTETTDLKESQPKKWSALVWSVPQLIAAADRGVESADLLDAVQPIELKGHFNRITAATFSPREQHVLTCDSQGRVILWDLNSRTELWSKRHHSSRITGCLFSPDGSQIYLSSTDHTISRVDARTGNEDKNTIFRHDSAVTSLAISPDGGRLLSVSILKSDLLNPGSSITLWDLANSTRLRVLESTSFAVNDISFTPQGNHAIAVSTDNAVRVMDLQAADSTHAWGKPILDFQKLGGLVWSASFIKEGTSILTVGGSEARIWDAVTLREEMSFSPHGAVAAADFSANGKLIATGSWDNSAKIWDVATGQAVMKLLGGHSGYINSVAFSPDSRHLLTGSDDMTAKIWDVTTGKVIQSFIGHKSRVRQAIYSPDGKQVLTVSNDRTARLWDAQTGKQIGQPFVGHQWGVLCGAFSPDGKRLLTGSEDNQARLWDVETHQIIAIFEGHTAAISAVCFSDNGSRVFTASQDNSAKVWDASPGREGAEVLTLTEQNQELTSIALSPDGRQIVTGSRDGTAIVWLTAGWETVKPNGD